MLHAEQRLAMRGTLPVEGRVIARNAIMGVRELGARGAMLHQRKELFDESTDAPIATIITSLMLRGGGGCGDWGDAPDPLHPLPDRAPETALEIVVTEIQSLIYRLSGDLNPLHIDPAVAHAAGFECPILHGLSTMGMCFDLPEQSVEIVAADVDQLMVAGKHHVDIRRGEAYPVLRRRVQLYWLLTGYYSTVRRYGGCWVHYQP